MNMVLTGNPGCGKTTLARLIKRFLLAYGVLKKDVFIEANALELKGEYVGQTAPRVMSTVRSAIGGVLFLDEAYALAGESKRDCFSDEAIRTLLTEVENNRTSVMVILAGYRDKMSRLMRADPGMNRRFPNRVHLPDYTPEQLVQIAEEKASTRYNLTFGEGVQEKLQDLERKLAGELASVRAADGGEPGDPTTLHAIHDQLERRVAERTAGLARVNEALEREADEREKGASRLVEHQKKLRALALELSHAEPE